MSRKLTTSKQPSMSRAVSTTSLTMPPPSRIPNRPPSVISSSTTSVALTKSSDDEQENRATSPRKTLGRKIVAPGPTLGKGREVAGENGEINIQVIVRCRGRSPQELATTSPIITTTAGPMTKAITVETTPLASSSFASFTTASSYGGGGPTTKTYPFDTVFGPEADQTMVFREVAEGMLDEVLQGYNCTIFAYGQTGTGKTYTMQGDLELSPLSAPKDEAGIVPRVLHRLFSLLQNGSYIEYSVKCSYVELYNEELRDLLSADYDPVSAGQKQPMALGSGGQPGGLKLYEDGKKGVMIQGLEEVGIKNLKDALSQVNKGCQRRQVAETKMNTESSRSHTIFSVTVHVKESGLGTGSEDLLKVGKFNLVDLAGSEAIGRSGATDKRAREAGMINQSLLTLGRVISALVEKGSHIPYRESKLTRLLQDSLGGRTKTCIVATVSPTRSNMEETLSTLDYAIRAKSIRNRPEVNAHLTKTGLLKEYLGDIERLKNEVLAARDKNGIYIPEEQWREMHDQQAKMKSDYDEAKLRASMCTVELATKKKMFDELSEKMLTTSAELEQIREAERLLGLLLDEMRGELEVVRVRLQEENAVSEAYIHGEARLDGVAVGLKGVAQESVADVGGLFEKLARKAQVLGSNTDSATKFGQDLQGFSKDLKHGLRKMHAVQDKLGKQLQGEMEGQAARGRQDAEKELADLDTAFALLNETINDLASSVDQGKLEASEISSGLLDIKNNVQASVRQWAQQMSDKSCAMVEGLLEHQKEHMSIVGLVLDSTADLVNAFISIAQQHMATESAAAAKARQLAEQTADTEIARLKAQNVLLAQLLTSEKAKTARLRTDLVQNLTSLIVGFTDAQDASWSEAVATVQAANDAGVNEMGSFATAAGNQFAESSQGRQLFARELDLAGATSGKQRIAGRDAMQEVQHGLRGRLEEYGRETMGEASRMADMVNGHCARLEESAVEVSSRAVSRAQSHVDALSSMSRGAQEGHDASRRRTESVAESIQTMSSSLLSSHASASHSFDKSMSATSQQLDNIASTTHTFLASGISEDQPTGITPRKRAWAVQQEWERTEPREMIIANLRTRRANGLSTDPPSFADSAESAVSAGTAQSAGPMDDRAPRLSDETLLSTINSTSPPPSLSEIQASEPLRLLTLAVPVPVSVSVSGIPPTSLSTSQMRMSKSKLSQLAGGKKAAAVVEERPAVAILGEGGVNLPRRGRK